MNKKIQLLTLLAALCLIAGFTATLKITLSIGVGSGFVGLPLLFGMSYDPDPRRRRGRPRKGVEPAGLKRWRLAHIRQKLGRYDPRRRTRRPRRRSMLRGYGSVGRKPFRIGSRGGAAWSGARKLRYDPGRRYQRLRHYGGRVGRGIEGMVNRWGSWLGGLLGLVYGVGKPLSNPEAKTAYGKYLLENYLKIIVGGDTKLADGTIEQHRIPEISHLWTTDGEWTPDKWLRYKFLGYNPADESYDVTRATWGFPFWLGVGAWILGKVAPKIPYAKRLNRLWKPLGKIGKGVAIVSGIGALALPNPYGNMQHPIPPPPNVNPQFSPQKIDIKYVGAY